MIGENKFFSPEKYNLTINFVFKFYVRGGREFA